MSGPLTSQMHAFAHNWTCDMSAPIERAHNPNAEGLPFREVYRDRRATIQHNDNQSVNQDGKVNRNPGSGIDNPTITESVDHLDHPIPAPRLPLTIRLLVNSARRPSGSCMRARPAPLGPDWRHPVPRSSAAQAPNGPSCSGMPDKQPPGATSGILRGRRTCQPPPSPSQGW